MKIWLQQQKKEEIPKSREPGGKETEIQDEVGEAKLSFVQTIYCAIRCIVFRNSSEKVAFTPQVKTQRSPADVKTA